MSQIQTQPEWKLRNGDEFRGFYQNELARHLQGLEDQRRRIMHNLMVLWLALAVLGVGGAVVGLASGQPGYLVLAMAAVAVIGSAGHRMIAGDFRHKFKRTVVSQMVHFFGPNFRYQPEGFVSEKRFRQGRIFDHRIDRYTGEDYITGMAGKTGFECSEVHAEYKSTSTNSKGHTQTHWHTIFNGLYFVADFNKDFKGITVVLPDIAEAAFGWIGQKFQEWDHSHPGSLVKLEDKEFEDTFVVYSTDQVEARYILSPSLMQRLVSLSRQFKNTIYVSFVAGTVHVAIDPGKNLFDLSVSDPICYTTCCELFHDLYLVLGIIDELNLNTRIWSKE